MYISRFSPAWFLLLALVIGGIVLCRILLKTEKSRKRFMVCAGIFVFVYLFLYKVGLRLDPNANMEPWNELPLNLCNIAAPLAVIAVLTGNRPLKAYVFLNCTLGAIIGVLSPYPGYEQTLLFSAMGIGYWGFHFLVLFLSLSMVTLDLYTPRYRDVLWAVLLFLGSILIAHGINLLLRATVYADANYFFTFGLEGNSIADMVYNLIPIPVVWELPVALPVAGIEALMVLIVRLIKKEK